MTSAQFIAKNYRIADGKERMLASIYKDGDGQIYSYGLHYPLLFTVDGLTFVNTRGYSSTTGKHIGWAWDACNYQGISVELDSRDRLPLTLDVILARLISQYDQIKAEMDAKTRTNTQVYRHLESRRMRVLDSLNAVKSHMPIYN